MESENAGEEQIELSAAASAKGATIIYLTTLGRQGRGELRTYEARLQVCTLTQL